MPLLSLLEMCFCRSVPRNSDQVQRDQESNRVEFRVKSDQGHGKVSRGLSPCPGTRTIGESPDFLYV